MLLIPLYYLLHRPHPPRIFWLPIMAKAPELGPREGMSVASPQLQNPSPKNPMSHYGPASSVMSEEPVNEVISFCFTVGSMRLADGGSDRLVRYYAIDAPIPTNPFSDST